MASLGIQGCAAAGKTASGPKFDVHPFIREHPDAVFVYHTSVSEKTDAAAIRQVGYTLSKELIVPSATGYPVSTKVNVKPNWTSAGPKDGKPVVEKLGINTDPNFMEGWLNAMRELGPQQFFARECCCPQQWEPMGWAAMCERAGIDLRPISPIHVWELKEGKDVIFKKIPNGVMLKEYAYMAPMNEEGSFLVNIAKLKSHGMGITASIKNLQGITCRRFHQFCSRYQDIRKEPKPLYEVQYHKYFQNDFERHIEQLYGTHVRDGIPRWNRPGMNGGIWQETWVHRALDNLSVTPTNLNIVEGIYSQDGNGFGIGPHDKLGPYGVTSRDFMSNIVIFGKDPFRVDIIAHWLAGHEPGNFGLFHIGIERGMSNVLNPHDIPMYEWKNGQASQIQLDSLTRTPLVTYFLQRDYDGQTEPYFHLCNEPFDYSTWKSGKRVGEHTPGIRNLGTDGEGRINLAVTIPERGEAGVFVYNSRGELVWKLEHGDLDGGVHHVVWDNFASPGLYNFYVKGMGWDAKLGVPIYPA
jgi:uncharacterized protein (DUF362 family)